MTTIKRVALGLCLILPTLGACSSDPVVVGKVIQGNMSFIGAVDEQDPRLKGPGLAGATVSAVSESGPSAGAMLGTMITDKNGDFKLPIRIQRALLYPIEFKTAQPGYLDANQTMPSPGSDRKLLIMLRPREGIGGSGASGGAPAGGG